MADSVRYYPNVTVGRPFWTDALSWSGSVTPAVMSSVLVFTLYGIAVGLLHAVRDWGRWGAVPAQFTAAILVLLLILRNNAGYERWWEARKLWGGIVNQSRNLAGGGLLYGPTNPYWREEFVRWTIAFCHVAKHSLRREKKAPELAGLLNSKSEAARAEGSQHMPSYVALRIAALLHEAKTRHGMDGYTFLRLDRERMTLVDHVGGCERILNTPLPLIHTIKLRRFIVLYLIWLPIAVAGDAWWAPGLITGLVSYPMLAIDRIAVELEDPFSEHHLSHLPLNDICKTIEDNLLALLEPDARPPHVSAQNSGSV